MLPVLLLITPVLSKWVRVCVLLQVRYRYRCYDTGSLQKVDHIIPVPGHMFVAITIVPVRYVIVDDDYRYGRYRYLVPVSIHTGTGTGRLDQLDRLALG